MSEPKYNLDSIIKRRGFLWKAFDLYEGSRGFYDYGPMGAAMKNNIINIWRRYFVRREGFAEIDTPNVTPEEIFQASGHLEKFNDMMLECSECMSVFRADHLIKEHYPEIADKLNIEAMEKEMVSEIMEENGISCPSCGGNFKEPYEFNLMFRTAVGRDKTAYLHPETAQGIFVNFRKLEDHFRGKLPFGVAQVGKGFRNEISPRQGVIRMREFNMAEAEVFIDPTVNNYPGYKEVGKTMVTLVDENGAVHYTELKEAVKEEIIKSIPLAYFIAITQNFLLYLGVDNEKLRFRQHEKGEMAHYANDCWDAELEINLSGKDTWVECVGIANRSCYDLEQHMKATGADLRIFKRYEEPIEKEVKKLKPDMRKIGKMFRKNAPAVKEYIDSLEPPFPEKLELKLKGETMELPPELYDIEKTMKKQTGERFLPWVIEPSFGVDRILYGILQHSFHTGKAREGTETESYSLLKLKPEIAPFQAAVFPLFNKEQMKETALKLHREISTDDRIAVDLDTSGSIGKRYARHDEIGTPYCITIDHQTLEDNTVTIRDRDSTEQIRINVGNVTKILWKLVSGKTNFEDISR